MEASYRENSLEARYLLRNKPETRTFLKPYTQLTMGYKMREIPVEKRSGTWEGYLVSPDTKND
jgi:hypothetical protein